MTHPKSNCLQIQCMVRLPPFSCVLNSNLTLIQGKRNKGFLYYLCLKLSLSGLGKTSFKSLGYRTILDCDS